MTNIVVFAESDIPIFDPELIRDEYCEHRSLDFIALNDNTIQIRNIEEYSQRSLDDINVLWIAGYVDLEKHRSFIEPNSLVFFDMAWEGGIDLENRQAMLELNKNIQFVMNYSDLVDPLGEFVEPVPNTHYFDYFAASAARRRIMEESSDTPVRDRPRKLCYLAGKIKKDARFLIAYQLYHKKLLDKTVLSLLGTDRDFDVFRKKYVKHIPTHFYTDIKPYIKSHFPLPNFKVDKRSETGSSYTGWPNDRRLYDLSSVSIVVETSDRFSGADPGFHTEKLYRTIYNRHPFVLQGCQNMLAHFKKKGFKTFDSIIDESYDKISFIRGKKEQGYEFKNSRIIVDRAIDLLNSIDTNHGKIQSIVDDNYNHMLSRSADEERKLRKFFREFINNSKGR